MTKRQAIAIAVLLCASGVLVKFVFFAKPVEYLPAAASRDWSTYTNEESGFQVLHPPGWNVRQDASLNLVELSPAGLIHLTVRRFDTPKRLSMDDVSFGFDFWHSRKGVAVVVNGIPARRMNYTVGNFDGTWPVESFFLQRGPLTYEISWSLGRGRDAHSDAYESAFREIVGTFKFIEIKHSDYLTYTDQKYHFSFTYPADWRLNSSPGHASLRSLTIKHDSDHWIQFTVTPNTTVPDELRRFGGFAPTVGEKREYFAHKILGQKYTNNDATGYYFEKDGNLYDIHIFRIAGPRKPLDEVLDSFAL